MKSRNKSKNTKQKKTTKTVPNDKIQDDKKIEEQKKEEQKLEEIKLLKKIKYPFHFIYRREIYNIPNQRYNTSLKKVIELISKKLTVPTNDLQVSYKNKKLSDLNTNVYNLIKDEKEKCFTVKKHCIYYIINY